MPTKIVRLCRRELEVLQIIKEHDEKGLEDSYLDTICDELKIGRDKARYWVSLLLRKRVIRTRNKRAFPKFDYKLSQRQRDVLHFIEAFVAEHGFAPSIREISEAFELKNAMSAKQHLDALRVKGYVDWVDGQNRTLRLVTHWRKMAKQAEEEQVVGSSDDDEQQHQEAVS